MNEDVQKWILKADNDLKVAHDEIKTENPATDAICFHCQQCCEKYLKTYLVFHQREFRKTHNLSELIGICKEIDEDFEQLRKFNVHELTIYATELQYPEYFYMPSFDEAREAAELAETVKNFVIQKLNANKNTP